jgi:acyl-CoA reductase-like NAD-dependent aldehyde dehydrogenase
MKHSDLTAGCAEALEKVFLEAFDGLPILQNLRIDHAQVAQVIADNRIRAVTFTGSTQGGRQVAQAAGYSLKKSVLELGGSDAYLVLADADLDMAADICAKARMQNNGQSCVAAKDLSHENVYDQFFADFFTPSCWLNNQIRYCQIVSAAPWLVKSFSSNKVASGLFSKEGAQLVFQTDDQFCVVPFIRLVLEVGQNLKSSYHTELFGPVAMLYKFSQNQGL